jgi:4-carboxymuconolactone decarboxylase
MARLSPLQREALTADQARLFDEIVHGAHDRRGHPTYIAPDGSLEGPFNAMLLSPEIGDAVRRLGAGVRSHSVLSDRCREIAILTVAAGWDSSFERRVHEQAGAAAGLSADEMSVLAAGRVPRLDDPVEVAVAETAHVLVHRHDLDERQYLGAIAVLGERQLFELVVLVGYYAQVALQLRVFRVTAHS